MRIIAVAALSLFLASATWAQPKPTLDAAYRDMYNLQFEAAHQVLHEFQKANPQDPLGYVSDAAAYLFGEFDRTLSLPIQGDPNGIKAEYRDGVLALLLPRAESDKPRTIKIS